MFSATSVAVKESGLEPATETRLYGGLCRGCLKAEKCTFPRDSSRPIRFCDEFEGYETDRLWPPAPVAPSLTAALPFARRTEFEDSVPKGLCRHCAHRPTCTYPKPEGGVWHCDELE
jgi:hypothetical protein